MAPQDLSSSVVRRLTLAVATPVALLVILGIVLGRQILRMADDSWWVDHTDQVLHVAADTLREAVADESATRAYLLTGDRALLAEADPVHARAGFDLLHQLTTDKPTQQARFDAARARYEEWVTSVGPVLRGEPLAQATAKNEIMVRKAGMDKLRDAMKIATDSEESLRVQRAEASASSIWTAKVMFLVLFVAAALLLAFSSRRDLAAVASTYAEALRSETAARQATEKEAWIRSTLAKFVAALQGERPLEIVGAGALALLAEHTGADVGAFFTKKRGQWMRRATHGLDRRDAGTETFDEREGLVGRAAIDGRVARLRDLPKGFFQVRAGTGEAAPAELVVVPAAVEGETNAILELGFLHPPDDRSGALLERIGESLAVAVRSAQYKEQLKDLLEETQRQAEELQAQQEELRVSNEELEAQTTALRATQRQLEQQQSELEQTNERLGEQALMLDRQRAEVALKAAELERTSQFKSEFLSNMSHELRTPLNSSLILAKLLADNKEGNLTEEQVKFAEMIGSAGNDLLILINDVLDLSKIEAGRMDVHAMPVPLERVRANLRRTFEVVAKDKGIVFGVEVDPSAPESIQTDVQRLDQIVKNLVSNALKFTSKGEVVVRIRAADDDAIAFDVRDTGIGIPSDQTDVIFQAFRQADGTTSRKYGGTGLGLAISRELARLLGGDLSVKSEVGRGSTFTLRLPRAYAGPSVVAMSTRPSASAPEVAASTPSPGAHGRERAHARAPLASDEERFEAVEPGKRVLVVVEDDDAFAQVVARTAKEAGFQGILATTAERGFLLAKRYVPAGIVLDIRLPDHSGLSLLDRLKRDPATRHVPVHVISGLDASAEALAMGAAGYLMKPVTTEQLLSAFKRLEERGDKRLRRLLVVEDDVGLRESVAKLLGRSDLEISTAASVDEALALLKTTTFDCVVTDLSLPGRSGYELLETIASQDGYSVPPVIVYTGSELQAADEQRLRRYSRSIILKGARSPERLLDEVTLFLHHVEADLPAEQQRMLKQARSRESIFEGRKVLVVEDDVRNVFALTSLLEPKGAKVIIARNGREALAALDKEPRVDLVLMDIMMPEMDGLEATREIRKNPQWKSLPVIAITAKAMRDDQERCMAAGANDFIAKPIDVEMLLSLLRVWMPKA